MPPNTFALWSHEWVGGRHGIPLAMMYALTWRWREFPFDAERPLQTLRARRWNSCVLAAGVAAMTGAAASGQTFPTNFTATSLSAGLTSPTSMAVAPDGSVYITQQTGALKVWKAGTTTTLNAFPVDSAGERGLIGVAVDPNFASNRYVYVHYTNSAAPVHNVVRRITVDAAGTAMVPGSETPLIDMNNLSGATNHNGGAIHFGADGKLYISVGDNANSSNSQTVANLLGKILRINSDPANVIPTDNPTSFPGIAGTPAGNNRAIWAVGLRNPFTFAVHPLTGRMFIDDVGENTWEEINDGIAGRNYGWSATEGRFTAASFPNFTNPLVAYHHTNGALNFPANIGSFTGFAIVGGAFYAPAPGTKPNFPIAYNEDYFFGDNITSIIRTFDPVANNGAGFATGVSGVVAFGLAPDNTLLVLRRGGTGGATLFRLTYTGTSGACCAPSGACSLSNGLNCAAGSSFIWGTVSCSPQPCAQPTGACCAVDGICSTATAAACTGVYQGDNSPCLPNPCPQPTGACCATDGTCGVSTAAACAGVYQGNGAPCLPNPCPQPTGACCDGSICTITTAAACAGATQHFAGTASVCNIAGNNATPCCKSDFNHDSVTAVSDIFQFLAAWFTSDPRADFNGDAAVNVTDIFDFLAAWFAGC